MGRTGNLDGHRAMAHRETIKVMVQPLPPVTDIRPLAAPKTVPLSPTENCTKRAAVPVGTNYACVTAYVCEPGGSSQPSSVLVAGVWAPSPCAMQ